MTPKGWVFEKEKIRAHAIIRDQPADQTTEPEIERKSFVLMRIRIGRPATRVPPGIGCEENDVQFASNLVRLIYIFQV
jgi:hypothetical protein